MPSIMGHEAQAEGARKSFKGDFLLPYDLYGGLIADYTTIGREKREKIGELQLRWALTALLLGSWSLSESTKKSCGFLSSNVASNDRWWEMLLMVSCST